MLLFYLYKNPCNVYIAGGDYIENNISPYVLHMTNTSKCICTSVYVCAVCMYIYHNERITLRIYIFNFSQVLHSESYNALTLVTAIIKVNIKWYIYSHMALVYNPY